MLCPSCPLGNRATVAAARTTVRRTLHLLPVTLPRLDIDAREQPSKRLQNGPATYALLLPAISSLLRDSCHLIEESDQVLPNQVINDQHHGKNNCHVRVVHVHDAKVEKAAVCRLQESQRAPEEKSERGDDEGKKRAMNPQRQVCA